jgi:spore germination protein YaaH
MTLSAQEARKQALAQAARSATKKAVAATVATERANRQFNEQVALEVIHERAEVQRAIDAAVAKGKTRAEAKIMTRRYAGFRDYDIPQYRAYERLAEEFKALGYTLSWEFRDWDAGLDDDGNDMSDTSGLIKISF